MVSKKKHRMGIIITKSFHAHESLALTQNKGHVLFITKYQVPGYVIMPYLINNYLHLDIN